MKSFILISLGLIASSVCCGASKQKVFVKPLGLDTQDLCARMPDGVLIGDSTDCRLFYYCLNYQAEAVRCRPGYYFDHETSYCLRGDCPAAGPSTRCTSPNELFTRIEGKCSSFNLCHNGILLNFECPVGTYYDDNKKTCMSIGNNVHHKCACIMPEYTALPNDHNCHSYYMCIDGMAILQLCEKGLFFNEHLNTCVPDVRGTCAVQNATKYGIAHVVKPQKPIKKQQKPLLVPEHEKPQTHEEHNIKPDIKNGHKDHKDKDHKDQHKNGHKNEFKNEHSTVPKDKDNENHKIYHDHKTNNKQKEIVTDLEKQEFLNDIHDELIEKKKNQLFQVHQAHKDKIEAYEKCILSDEKKNRPEQSKADKDAENHRHNHKTNNKPKELDTDREEQEFLKDIHDEVIEKKKILIKVHQAHKDKAETFILNGEKDNLPEQSETEHESPKPLQKEIEPESKPTNKLPTQNKKKPNASGVYHKLNSKFII